MTGLIPFNRRGNHLMSIGAGFEDFYNMIDGFFSESMLHSRSLTRDTFKIDIEETDKEYRIEAELPGVRKDQITLNVEDDNLNILVTRMEEIKDESKNYLHRERRASSMSRRVRLANVKLDEIKAKLEEGILTVTIPKHEKVASTRKIEIE